MDTIQVESGGVETHLNISQPTNSSTPTSSQQMSDRLNQEGLISYQHNFLPAMDDLREALERLDFVQASEDGTNEEALPQNVEPMTDNTGEGGHLENDMISQDNTGNTLGNNAVIETNALVPQENIPLSQDARTSQEGDLQVLTTDLVDNDQGANGNTNDIDERRSSSDSLELIEYHFLDRSQMTNTSVDGPTEPIPAFVDLTPPPSVGNIPSIPTTPPPTYAEIMKDAIPLSFIDFWPQCISLNDDNFLFSKFETFDRLIDAANSWLLQQENVVIRNCETVEMKASSRDEYIVLTAAKTSTFKSSSRPLLCIKGLRLWYTSKIINKLPFAFAVTPFTIAYTNYKATLINVDDHLEYEKFPSLVLKCNDDLQSGKINGRILNVESVYLKEPDFEDPPIHGKTTFEPDDTTWRDYYSKNALLMLRVYYIPEQPAQEELFFKEFIPDRSRRSRSHPKFRDFSTVMDDCRLWLVHLSSQYRLINAQTLEMKYVPKELGKMDSNLTYFSDYEGIPRVRFLRLFYSKDAHDSEMEYGAPLLSHKTFIPAPLKKKRHETLAALMHRVETWLRATGATVVCAETLPMLEQVYQEKNDADFSLYRSEWIDANNEYDHDTLLYVVRVYLDTVYPEPPPQIFLDGEDSDFDQDCILL